MRRNIGPWLLLAALVVPLLSLADTGGSASASLHILGPAGEAGAGGAVGEGCLPPLVPPVPPVLLEQTADLFHDPDGDGLLDPGDMVWYMVSVWNPGRATLQGLWLLVLFSPDLIPVALEGGWETAELGGIPAISLGLPPLEPGQRRDIGFAARFAGSDGGEPAAFMEALVYGEDFALAADSPDTGLVLDPAVVAVREVSGGAGSLFPGPAAFSKEVTSPSPMSRVVEEGAKLEFAVSYTPAAADAVEILDFVPAPLRVDRGSIRPRGAEVVELGGLTVLRARFPSVPLGTRVSLKYSVSVGPVSLPYVATHAIALSRKGILFSDDPLTAERGDPTAVLFPWIEWGWSPAQWEGIFSAGEPYMPVVVVQGGTGELRWARCSRDGEPGELLLTGIVWVPLRDISPDTAFGLIVSRLLYPVREIYVPSVYGLPVFSPLEGGMGTIGGLKGPFCEGVYLPVLVELPGEPPPEMTGVVVDEGL